MELAFVIPDYYAQTPPACMDGWGRRFVVVSPDGLLLPCLLALGVGLSLNNARAVLEAVFNHQSDFNRTPKYGIERKSQPWRNCKYMPLKSLLPIAEAAFAIYFTYFVWYAIAHRQFLSVPFLLMFQAGFLYVSLSSLAPWWPRISFGSSRAAAAIPA